MKLRKVAVAEGRRLYYEQKQKDAACFPALFDLMVKQFSENYMRMAIPALQTISGTTTETAL